MENENEKKWWEIEGAPLPVLVWQLGRGTYRPEKGVLRTAIDPATIIMPAGSKLAGGATNEQLEAIGE